ncbi:MAG: uridine diphosphate-N-acetylglucosamine-binding protein YvcK [Actinomycetota bacterium]
MSSSKVVSLGGGHGLAATLTAMRGLTSEITAVVTVADNGGSSGRLRSEFGSLPPGDLRMALSALCSDDEWGRGWADVLQHRFSTDGELNGHALGNLLLMALWDKDGDAVNGIRQVGNLLRIVGEVLPMSLDPLDIEGTFDTSLGKKIVRGQVEVATTKGHIESLRLIPENPRVTPQVLTAVEDADWITFGPGSWFSSVMPHFLLPELAASVMTSQAKRIMVLNLPEPSTVDEFAGSSAADHLDFILQHVPHLRIDYAIVDPTAIEANSRLKGLVEGLGGELVVFPLSKAPGSYHHDVEKLRTVFAHIMEPTLLR